MPNYNKTKINTLCGTTLAILGALLLIVQALPDIYSPALFLVKAASTQLIFIFIVICLIYFFSKPKKNICILLLCLDVATAATIIAQVSFNSGTTPAAPSLSITTFSALSRTRNGNDIAQFLHSNTPSIACFQEVTGKDTDAFKHHFKYLHKPNNEDLATASNFPLTFVSAKQGILVSELSINKQVITVVNVHMTRPYKAHNIGKAWQQLLALANDKAPIILCGDFNMTPYSSLYKVITQQLQFVDSHNKGYGFGFTFPHKQRRISILGPQVRIDYIFTKGVPVISSHTYSLSNNSDHKAVTATFTENK